MIQLLLNHFSICLSELTDTLKDLWGRIPGEPERFLIIQLTWLNLMKQNFKCYQQQLTILKVLKELFNKRTNSWHLLTLRWKVLWTVVSSFHRSSVSCVVPIRLSYRSTSITKPCICEYCLELPRAPRRQKLNTESKFKGSVVDQWWILHFLHLWRRTAPAVY